MRNLAAALLLSILAAGCGAQEAGKPAPAPPGDPEDGAALLVEVQGEPGLSGRHWPGDLVCLPPAKQIILRPVGEAKAAFKLAEDRGFKWAAAGGVTRQVKGGLELFTPQLSGSCYGLALDPGGGALPHSFTLLILHEAEVSRSRTTGRWSVRMPRVFAHTYPNPEKSKSWRVRMHKELFRPPRFWMEITPASEKLLLAPHVEVGQMVGFVTTKSKKAPKRRHAQWFPVNRPFVYKLEMLNRELIARKIKFKRLAVNSGFRTPRYNRKIGGGAYSRHMYGDAADVMFDEDGDEVCDDVTGDGKADEQDGLVIGGALRALEAAGRVRPGGVGVYGFDAKDSCGSYCHFDSRGYLTRWGTVYKKRRRKELIWWPAAEYREDQEPPPEFRYKPGGKAGKK